MGIHYFVSYVPMKSLRSTPSRPAESSRLQGPLANRMVIPTQGHQYLASGFEKPSGVIGDPFIVSDLFLYLDFI
jgi:hypothetical protein